MPSVLKTDVTCSLRRYRCVSGTGACGGVVIRQWLDRLAGFGKAQALIFDPLMTGVIWLF